VQIMDEINLPAADPEKNNSCVHEKCQIAWQDHGLEYDSLEKLHYQIYCKQNNT
jgi:hypothetical protein